MSPEPTQDPELAEAVRTLSGTVDIFVRDIPWDQALETILRANKLGYVAEGTIIRIAPLNVLADEEAERRKLAEARAVAPDPSGVAVTAAVPDEPDRSLEERRAEVHARAQDAIDAMRGDDT